MKFKKNVVRDHCEMVEMVDEMVDCETDEMVDDGGEMINYILYYSSHLLPSHNLPSPLSQIVWIIYNLFTSHNSSYIQELGFDDDMVDRETDYDEMTW